MARIIGISGGIGSGKSYVSSILREKGYTVYDTDSEAKRLIVNEPSIRKAVEDLLGTDVFDGDSYLTQKVAERVFCQPTLLAQLNAIVHPAVSKDILSKAAMRDGILFVESAILFPSHLDAICYKTVWVTAPEEVRIERVIARDHTSKAHVHARLKAQKEESAKADLVIINDGEQPVSVLVEQILSLIS